MADLEQDLEAIGQKVVACLDSAGICSRLFGGVAIATKSHAAGLCFGRKLKDLDIVVEAGLAKQAAAVLRQDGWLVDRRSLMFSDGRRVNLFRQQDGVQLDLFQDPLEFNHRILLGKRLALEDLTISTADLLLTKLQIVDFTGRDLRDVILLLESVAGAQGVNEVGERMSDCCSRDWGLYHTCLANLVVVEGCLDGCATQAALSRLMIIRRALEGRPKTLSWKVRSVIGARWRWYLEVD